MSEFRYGLRFKTAKFISSIEGWLARNCTGGWNMRLDGVSDDLDTKCYLFRFESSNDLQWFKYAMSQHGMPDRPAQQGRGSARH